MDLEKQAYLLSQELDFHASIMQEGYNEVLERPEHKPSAHYFKGSVTEAAEDANSVYKDALNVMELQEIFNLGDFEEEPEEEVRLAKEKYFSRGSHDYTGFVEDAMNSHNERVFEARKSDIIGNATGFHHLRSSVLQYEELIRQIADAEPRKDDAEIIESSDDTIEIDEINHILGKEN